MNHILVWSDTEEFYDITQGYSFGTGQLYDQITKCNSAVQIVHILDYKIIVWILIVWHYCKHTGNMLNCFILFAV